MNQRQYLLTGALLILAALCVLAGCEPAPTPTPTPLPIPSAPPLMELGVNSLNDPVQGNGNAGEATAIGASRDRWAVEWFWVEQPWREDDPRWRLGKGEFGWRGVFYLSHLIPNSADISFDVGRAAAAAKSLKPLVVLHGIPRIYDCTQTYVDPPRPSTDDIYEHHTACDIASDPNKSRIEGLFKSVVVGGAINPDNRWANFAFSTMKYLIPYGITEYAVWNEPDRQWRADPTQDPGNISGRPERAWVDDYVRLVQVTGEAAQQAGDITLVLGAPSSDESLYTKAMR